MEGNVNVSRLRFLGLGNIDIGNLIILCCGCCPVNYKMFSSRS